jgi:hypothetical protein
LTKIDEGKKTIITRGVNRDGYQARLIHKYGGIIAGVNKIG